MNSKELQKKKREFEKSLELRDFPSASVILIENRELLDSVLNEFIAGNYQYHQQLSRVFDELKKENLHRSLEPYYKRWIAQLDRLQDDGFLRNTYRYFQDVDVSEDLQGILYDRAFNHMVAPLSAIAIKAFALTVCFQIAKSYPELFDELERVIPELLKSESPGVRSRASKILSDIQKMKD